MCCALPGAWKKIGKSRLPWLHFHDILRFIIWKGGLPMRPDGTRVKDLPPLVAAIPYIMPKRYDA